MASEETYKLGHARIRCDTHSQAHTRHADWHRSTCPISLPPVDTDQCPPSLDVHTSVCRTLHPNWKEQTCQVRHRFAHVTARTHTLAQAHTETARRARANAQTQCGTHTHMQAKRRGALVGPYCQEAWTLHSFRCAPQMHQKRRNMKCKGDARTHACMRHATHYAVLIYAIPATHVAITTHKLKGLALSTTMPAAHTVHINNYYAR